MLLLGSLVLSLPSRERGLKSFGTVVRVGFDIVAPFAGAWIEISISSKRRDEGFPSLPSRERGLKFPDADP